MTHPRPRPAIIIFGRQYQNSNLLYDVVSGCNAGCGQSQTGFCAEGGWDPVTGFGEGYYRHRQRGQWIAEYALGKKMFGVVVEGKHNISIVCMQCVCVYVYAISYRSRLLSTLHMYFFPFLRHARLCAPKTSGPDPVKRSGTAACNQFDVLLALC